MIFQRGHKCEKFISCTVHNMAVYGWLYLYNWWKKPKTLFLKELSIEIWKNLVKLTPVEQMIELFMKDYDSNDAKLIEEYIHDFTENLIKEGILYEN